MEENAYASSKDAEAMRIIGTSEDAEDTWKMEVRTTWSGRRANFPLYLEEAELRSSASTYCNKNRDRVNY